MPHNSAIFLLLYEFGVFNRSNLVWIHANRFMVTYGRSTQFTALVWHKNVGHHEVAVGGHNLPMGGLI